MVILKSDDTQLVAALQQGEHSAFKVIYERYWKALYVIAVNRLNDKDLAGELLQDIFLDLWERREKLAIYKSLQSYLFTSLKYKILNHFKKEAVKRKYHDEVSRGRVVADMATDHQLTFDELYEELHQALEKLPKQCGVIFKMSRFEEMSSKEIASALHIAPKTVDNQINKALKIIRGSSNSFSPEVS